MIFKKIFFRILQPTFCSVPTQKAEWNLKANFLYLYYTIKEQLVGKKNPEILIFISLKIHRILFIHLFSFIKHSYVTRYDFFVVNRIFLSILYPASSYPSFYHFIGKQRAMGFSEESEGVEPFQCSRILNLTT